MRWRDRRTYIELVLIFLILMQFTWTWYLQHKTVLQITDKGQNTIVLDRTTVVQKEEKYNKSWDLNLQQFTGQGFLQMWNDMRGEFITRLQMLLDDGATGTDPRLIRLIQSQMFPPSNGVYKLSYHYDPGMHYQLTTDHFKKKGIASGFFVECGGLDGERSSTTYDLEKDLGWEGILIEADPDYFFQSLGKNRKSWKLHAALCPSTEPKIVKFQEQGNSGGGKLKDEGMPIPCIPLPLILKALNRTRVDFLSLDVEGTEMEILRSLPYDDLDIEAINMEYIHNKEKPPSFKKFMTSVGYRFVRQIYEGNAAKRVSTFDLYFVKMEK